MADGSKRTERWWTYNQVWKDHLINSQSFREPGHDNPSQWRIKSQDFAARNVKIGHFRLNSGQVRQIGSAREESVDNLLPAGSRIGRSTDDDDSTGSRAGTKRRGGGNTNALAKIQRSGLHVSAGRLYSGEVSAPRVGDLQVSFRMTAPSEASIVGLQTEDGFAPFRAPSGDTIELIEEGIMLPHVMFEHAQTNAWIRTMAIRFFGWLFMFIGLMMVTGAPPLSTNISPLEPHFLFYEVVLVIR